MCAIGQLLTLDEQTQPVENCGYVMIKSFSVENFRCFAKISLSDLRRVNVVVGKNAAGKTALPEAIKLGLEATPSVVPWLNANRGIPFFVPPNVNNEQFQGAFLDFFHRFDPRATISTIVTDSLGKTGQLLVRFDPLQAVTIQPAIGFKPGTTGPSGIPLPPAMTIVPLAFARKDFKGQGSTLFVTLNQNGQLQLQTGKALGLVSGFFSGSNVGNPMENAVWLSNLRIAKSDQEVIEALHLHFPFIKDVTPEIYMGVQTIYADIPSLPRKLPLSMISGGISRLFTLMLAIVTHKGGVVLIDEVENGIYYDQYPQVWRTLYELAAHHDTQLFVSSHSIDCLKAILPIIRGKEDDFTLLRADKKNGNSIIHSVEGKFFQAAIEQGFDPR